MCARYTRAHVCVCVCVQVPPSMSAASIPLKAQYLCHFVDRSSVCACIWCVCGVNLQVTPTMSAASIPLKTQYLCHFVNRNSVCVRAFGVCVCVWCVSAGHPYHDRQPEPHLELHGAVPPDSPPTAAPARRGRRICNGGWSTKRTGGSKKCDGGSKKYDGGSKKCDGGSKKCNGWSTMRTGGQRSVMVGQKSVLVVKKSVSKQRSKEVQLSRDGGSRVRRVYECCF